jgi:restriction system protein
MARSKTNKRQKNHLHSLLEKGVLCTTLGLAFLSTPLFFKSSAVLNAIATGLRIPGLLALGVGLVFIALYFVMKAKVEAADLPQSQTIAPPGVRKPQPKLALVPAVAEMARPMPLAAWSPAVFAAIEWRRFEAVCEALFAQAGFSTRAQSHGADGGVDIWLHSAHAQGPVGVVQCKHWQGKPVGVREMREFFGVMASHQLKRGIYATTSTYTQDAQQFAKDNSINALDGPALLALIAKRTPAQQQALLAVAYEGDYWRPTCASCGTKMVERTPAKGGAGFWGCAGFPKCRRTLQMVG